MEELIALFNRNSREHDIAYLNSLSEFLSAKYGLKVTEISPAKRGYFGETWRVDTPTDSFFAKLSYSAYHQAFYRNSFTVLKHLCAHGIRSISIPVPTLEGGLYCNFNDSVCGLFEWITGENVQNLQTKRAEYSILAAVYAVNTEGLAMSRETIGVDIRRRFSELCESVTMNSTPAARRIEEVLKSHQDEFAYRTAKLVQAADRCRDSVAPLVITHGDPGGNMIINGADAFLVDWDGIMLASPERDAWFGSLYWGLDGEAHLLFESCLKKQGIEYRLNPMRLAYYCYYSWFYYLTEYLLAFDELGDDDGYIASQLEAFFSGWINHELGIADQMWHE